MKKTVNRKAVFHKPTGKWVNIFSKEEPEWLGGEAVDGVEEATLFLDDITLEKALDRVDLEFAQSDIDYFELRDVEVTYRTKE